MFDELFSITFQDQRACLSEFGVWSYTCLPYRMNAFFFLILYSPKKSKTNNEVPEAKVENENGITLTLNPAVNDVSGQGKCTLKVNHNYVRLKTREHYEEFEMPVSTRKGNTVDVHVTDELRGMLDQLEREVKKQIPKGKLYKPLYQGDTMCLKLSRFCKYFLYDVNQHITAVSVSDTAFKAGHYVYLIRVPHLYVGHHKNGEHCSLSMDVDEVYYLPDQKAIRSEQVVTPWQDQFRHN